MHALCKPGARPVMTCACPMHARCTLQARSVHTPCRLYAHMCPPHVHCTCPMHDACTVCERSVHAHYTPYARTVYALARPVHAPCTLPCKLHASSVCGPLHPNDTICNPLYTLHARPVRSPCAPVQGPCKPVHFPCISRARPVHAPCTPRAHPMHAPCTHHACSCSNPTYFNFL